jgi:N-acetylmuramoyl-L-alanine amidase
VLKELMLRLSFRFVLPAVVLAAFVWVAAPALSAQPYVPGAVDFEQALGDVHHAAGVSAGKLRRSAKRLGKGPVSYRSATLTAPKRFDLAGLAGELRPLELRARDDGGEWSEWVEAEDGNPVYFGGADQIQVRARGWRPSGTLHYVNVSGTTSPASGLLTAARETINSAFIRATRVVEPAAEAAPAEPQIITRAEWGANLRQGGCPPREAPAYGTVKAGVIHHTVSANDYSEAEAPGIVLGICRYHRNANGWNDIGYQALVDRFGNIYQGRAGGIRKAVIGAQAQGFNAQTTAVASIGTHTKETPTQAAAKAIVSYLGWKLAVHGVNAVGKTTLTSAGGDLSRYPNGRRVRLNEVIGHGTIGRTSCPGKALAAKVPQLRRRIQKRIKRFGGVEDPTSPPETTDPTGPGGGVTPK